MIWYVLTAFSWCAVGLDGRATVAVRHSDPQQRSSHFDNGPPPSSANDTVAAGTMDAFRLPSDVVVPVSYQLQVATDFERFAYSGRVDVVVRAIGRSCRIIMNVKDVRVTEVTVIDRKTNANLPVAEFYPVRRNEQLVIALNDTGKTCLVPSRLYSVNVTFNASLRDDMSGYYRSSYAENDVTKWLAVTKFEPTHARKAFPCFDEPALKASFKISLRRRSDQISLSNMPLLNSIKISQTNMFWDHFQETPPISTYLVAFFVGEFYALKTRTVGIYTHESFITQAEYVANKSADLLEAMENFTGVDYLLPKLDLLAIPDFAAGAMENWGLNTYRERLLLLSDNSKTKVKEFVTTVVQHELSHQWFGDLVTCAWWDYLWLNEGFATFFEYFATKRVEPTWRMEDVFVYEVHQDALESDQSPTHPITGSVKSPAQIKDMFDDISYSKAGAVLRMLQYTVTENNFKMALNLYLENNKYNAATPEELWNAFENVLYDADFELDENVSVTEFMKSWTEQTGYPLINVMKVNDTFVISQERFLVKTSNEIETTKWIVGLTYTTESKKDFNDILPKTWLTGKKLILPNQTEHGWYIFNLQSIGFFRVNYKDGNWNALINQLDNDCNVIHVLNRAQIIDDAFNLALADQLDYTVVLRLTKYLKNEYDVVPWYSVKKGFAYLLNRMRRCPNGYKYLKTYVRYLAGLIYMKTNDLVVNHNSTDHSVKTAWNAFSNWACKLDNEICTNSALSYFYLWQQGKEIPADIKDAAFCVGVKYGNSEVWNSMLMVYVNSISPSDRQSAQWALSCSEDSIQLSKYLDLIFEGSDGLIRPQDFKVIYQTLASSSKGISVLIEFLINNLDRIVNEIINGEQVATSIYSLLASRVALDKEISKIDVLRISSSVPAYLQKKFNSSYSTVEENLAWFKMYHPIVGEWSKATVNQLGLESVQSTERSTTVSSDMSSEITSTEFPSSSSDSVNGQTFVFILTIIILSTLIIIN